MFPESMAIAYPICQEGRNNLKYEFITPFYVENYLSLLLYHLSSKFEGHLFISSYGHRGVGRGVGGGTTE